MVVCHRFDLASASECFFYASPRRCGSSGNMDVQRHSNAPMGEGLNDVKCASTEANCLQGF